MYVKRVVLVVVEVVGDEGRSAIVSQCVERQEPGRPRTTQTEPGVCCWDLLQADITAFLQGCSVKSKKWVP